MAEVHDPGMGALLIEGFDDAWSPLGNRDSELFFLISHTAPRSRIVAIELQSPAEESWRPVVPEGENVLTDASLVGGHLID